MGTPTFVDGSSALHIPQDPSQWLGMTLVSYTLTIYDPYNATPVNILGYSEIDDGSLFYIADQSLGGPGPLQNDGTMFLHTGSTLKVGAITGTGQIIASQGSAIDATSAATSETVQLNSSMLDVGGDGIPNPGLRFLAPVNGFDQTSQIDLEDTTASLEIYFRQSGALYLFEGPQMVAHMTIKGSAPPIYANDLPTPYGHPGVILSAAYHGWGHVVPAVMIG